MLIVGTLLATIDDRQSPADGTYVKDTILHIIKPFGDIYTLPSSVVMG